MSPSFVLEVRDQDGAVLEQWEAPQLERVFDTQVARQIEDIMSDNAARTFIFGANSPLILKDRVVAAKTGTTNDWHDGWTLGYTPSLVAGVWAGNNDNAAMKKGSDGVLVAAPIWNAFMVRVLANTPVEIFTKPDPVFVDKGVLRGQAIGTVRIKIDSATNVPATDATPPGQIIETEVNQPHDILYFVDKDNPRGPAPSNPARDPQFATWEGAVERWGRAHGYEYDGIAAPAPLGGSSPSGSTPDVAPTVVITNPLDQAVLQGSSAVIAFQVQASRIVRSIEAFLGEAFLGTAGGSATTFPIPLDTVPAGFYVLKIRVIDEAGSAGSAQITVEVKK